METKILEEHEVGKCVLPDCDHQAKYRLPINSVTNMNPGKKEFIDFCEKHFMNTQEHNKQRCISAVVKKINKFIEEWRVDDAKKLTNEILSELTEKLEGNEAEAESSAKK